MMDTFCLFLKMASNHENNSILLRKRESFKSNIKVLSTNQSQASRRATRFYPNPIYPRFGQELFFFSLRFVLSRFSLFRVRVNFVLSFDSCGRVRINPILPDPNLTRSSHWRYIFSLRCGSGRSDSVFFFFRVRVNFVWSFDSCGQVRINPFYPNPTRPAVPIGAFYFLRRCDSGRFDSIFGGASGQFRVDSR